jgi:uncharacterized protein (TIGR02145 family)
MPDGRTWFAQNLNYTKDLTYNAYAYEANGKQFTSNDNGIPAIGSYWCPAVNGSVTSGSEADCRTYGALYTWETAMMVDGKYADETKTSTAWDESWVSPYYNAGAPNSSPNADKNNARGGTNVKGGGRGICPLGWHVPTLKEWTALLDLVNDDGTGTSYADASCGGYGGKDVLSKLRDTVNNQHYENMYQSWEISCDPPHGTVGFDLIPSGYLKSEIIYKQRSGLYGLGSFAMHHTASKYNNNNVIYITSNVACDTYVDCNPSDIGIGIRCLAD